MARCTRPWPSWRPPALERGAGAWCCFGVDLVYGLGYGVRMDNTSRYYRICFDASAGEPLWYVMSYADREMDEDTREHVGILEKVEPVENEDETELRRALREEYPHTASGDVEVIRER